MTTDRSRKDKTVDLLSRRELLRTASLLGLSGAALAAVHSTQGAENRVSPTGRTAEAAKPANGAARIRTACVLGYFPDWTSVDPSRLDFSLYTHLCHAFAGVRKSGPIHFPDDTQTQALIRAAHAKKTRVLLSLGGADSNAALIAQNTDTLADGLAQRVHDLHYDGIDVDWEAPENDQDAAKLSALVQALRKRMPKALLTMAVSSDDYSGRWFHTEDLLPAVDWLNIMTYDFCGPWCDKVLHNAPLPKVTEAISYWKGRGWPADKLMLGIPNYGRRMHATRFGDPAPPGTYIGDEVSYNDTQTFIKNGWKPMRDADAQVPYLVNPEGSEIISYDDETSVHLKGQLARTSDLRGYFFWEITSDFDGKTHRLAHAAHEGWIDLRS